MKLLNLVQKYKILSFLILTFTFYLTENFAKIDAIYALLNTSITILFPLIITLVFTIDFRSIRNTVLHRKFLETKKGIIKEVIKYFYIYLIFTFFYTVNLKFLDTLTFFEIKGFIFDFDLSAEKLKNSIMMSASTCFILLKYIKTIKSLNEDWINVFSDWELKIKEDNNKEVPDIQKLYKKVADDNLKTFKKISELEKLINKKTTKTQKKEI